MPFKINQSLLNYKRPAPDRDFKHPISGFASPMADRRFTLESRWESEFMKSFLDAALGHLQAVGAAVARASQIEVNPDLRPEKAAESVKTARLEVLRPSMDALAELCAREVNERFAGLTNLKSELLDATRAKPTDVEAVEVRTLVRGLSGEAKRDFIQAALAGERFGVFDCLEASYVPVDEPGTYNSMRVEAVIKKFPVLANVLSDRESLCIFAQKIAREIIGMASLATEKALNIGVNVPCAIEYRIPDEVSLALGRAAPKGKPDSSRYRPPDESPMPDRLPSTPKPHPITVPSDPQARLKSHRQKVFGAPRS